MAIRIKVRQNESVQQLLRRFKKLCEKEGLTKEVKKRQHYEKPSERARRAARRAVNRYSRPLTARPGQGPTTFAGPGGGRTGGPRTGPDRGGRGRTPGGGRGRSRE